MRWIYDNHIKKVADDLGQSIARADDFFSASAIVEEIWSALNAAKVIIADCTGKNPNVFYELGIAHTLGKPVITISQTIDDVPFDVKHRRAIVYSDTHDGRKVFEQTLAKTLETELSRGDHVAIARQILRRNGMDATT